MRPPAPRQSSNTLLEQDDAWLLETPSDLICPITHELFKDPVINAAGQVYERAAIVQHLQSKATDPVTNAPLTSDQLIPVYTLKSRSFEFREHVAKACVEKACSTRSCEVAAQYLRRAAELVAGVIDTLKVPGLCDEVVQFLYTHPSNIYDAMALRMFADGLRKAGYIDQASKLYLRLVEYGEDRSQQAAALQQCLICVSQDGQPPTDKGMLPFLVQFLETQRTFGAADALELLHEAGVHDAMLQQLCEQLLTLLAHSSNSGSGTQRLRSSHGGNTGQAAIQFDDLMLQYTRLRFVLLQQQLDQLQAAASNNATTPSHKHQHASDSKPCSKAHNQNGYAGQKAAEGHGSFRRPAPRLQKFIHFVSRRRRALTAGMFAAVSLLHSRNVASRALKAGSALLMVYCHNHMPDIQHKNCDTTTSSAA